MRDMVFTCTFHYSRRSIARMNAIRALLLSVFVAVLCIANAMAAMAATAAPPERLLLSESNREVKTWPYARVLFDKERALSAEQALALLDQFQRPTTSFATLGVNSATLWMHVPLTVAPSIEEHWIAEIDYPPLNYVDIVLAQNGRIIGRAELGSLRPFASRPLLSRSHAAPLEFKPGEQYDLLVRVQTRGAMIVPLTLEKTDVFHSTGLAEQMLQGLLLGISLCLVFYSLGQWASSRERLFLKYVLLVSGSITFTLLQLGVGAQYLWTDNLWIEQHIAGLAAFTAIGGTFLFLEEALRETTDQVAHTPASRFSFARIMKGGAVLCLLIAIVYSLDWISVSVLTLIITVMGPLPSILATPRYFARARRGDAIGWYLLLAFTVYMISVIVITAVIRGQMPANFWTLHSFQFGATFDMLAFMYVLTLRTKAIRAAVQHASVERDIMRALAHSDPLTGLANRRSLSEALTTAIARCGPKKMLALYVIDLDNFKPVNDTYGHDVGDELLIAVGVRLQASTRAGDVVARLGGDEFVVLGNGLRNEHQAEELGSALLHVFKEPFALKTRTISLHLTIGYAIAPLNGSDSTTLLKLADDAMYQGKQQGKNRLQRA